MKWLTLYGRLGKQDLRIIKDKNVIAIIDNKEVELTLKYMKDGTPYLVPEQEPK